jgi:phenylacetate-CoA ligase
LLAGERYKGIHKLCKNIRDFEDLPPQQQLDQQWINLKGLVQHAYDSVPYYREVMDAYGLQPAAIHNMDDYRRLPELTQHTIRNRKKDLLSTKFQMSELRPTNTGGTTSTPMTFYRDLASLGPKTALQCRLNAWSDYNLGDKALWMWGARFDFAEKPSWKWSMLEKYGFGMRYLPIEGMDDITLARFVDEMRQFRPKIIYGYSNLVDLFSQYVIRHQCDIPFPKAVICTAEQLGNTARQNIQKALQAPLHEHYGSREASMVAVDLDGKTGMRFHGTGCIAEFVPLQRTPKGWIARLLITDLLNQGMPFLRYNTGDCVLVQDSDLVAHTAFPKADKIQGRVQDNLVLSNGQLLPGLMVSNALAGYARDLISIQSVQVVQEAISQLTLRYVAGENEEITKKELDSLERLLRSVIHDQFQLSFEPMHELPRSSSGKYRVVVCKIPVAPIEHHIQEESSMASATSV